MTAPLDALPLARRITEHAYRAGASLVTTLFSDEEATLMRFRHAPEDSFDKATGWLFEGMASGLQRRRGAARHRRRRSGAARRAGSREGGARQPRALEGLSAGARADRRLRHQLDHRLLRDAGLGAAVFPGEQRGRRGRASCGTAIFAASRIDAPDPVAAWQSHNARAACPRRSAQRAGATLRCVSAARAPT